ncbi:uncharacterized protein BKA78DRAFT_70479 [Phyllosticta capitalensis]|uniref:uncharacterized protein n=1 Tax=Phyllosticta capitalensis TaxID=121624 RepID=UPI00313000CE
MKSDDRWPGPAKQRQYFLFAVRFQKLLRKLLGRFICLGVPVSCSLPPSASAGAGVYSRKQPKLGKRKAEYVEALFYINAKLINCRIWNHDPRPVDIEPLHPELGSPSSIPTGLAGIQCPRRKAVLRFLGRNAKRTGVGLCEYHIVSDTRPLLNACETHPALRIHSLSGC